MKGSQKYSTNHRAMDTQTPTFCDLRDTLTQSSLASDTMAEDEDENALRHIPGRAPYQTGDDTLPSPPATLQLHPFCVGEDALHQWESKNTSDQLPPPQWMLQETLVEEGEADVGEEDRLLENYGNAVCTAEGNVMHAEPAFDTICMEEEGDDCAVKAHTSPLPVKDVSQRSSSGSSASSSPEAVFDPSHPPATSPRARQAALRDSSLLSGMNDTSDSEEENATPSSSGSTPLIEVPLPAALRDEPNAQATQQVEAYADRATAASRSHRPAVLVSPAMADDSPDNQAWISPGRADTVDGPTRASAERRDEEQGRGTCCATNDTLEDNSKEDMTEPYQAGARASASRSRKTNEAVPSRSVSNTGAWRSASLISPPQPPVVPLLTSSTLSSPSAEPRQPSVTAPSQQIALSPPSPLPDQLPDTPRGGTNTAEELSPATKGALQRLRLQLNQAERAAALQQALCEAAHHEKEDVQLQLDALLRIQSELERRSQLHEVAFAEAEQRHAAEKRRWEAEQQKTLSQPQMAHDAQLRETQDVVDALRAQLGNSNNEVQTLRLQLAEVHEELRALMEEYLNGKQQLLEARHAQADAAQQCASLKLKTEDSVKAAQSARLQSLAVKHLRAGLQNAEERAVVSQLAFRILCEQLAVVLKQRNPPMDSCDVSALSTSGHALPSVGDGRDLTTSTHKSAATQPVRDVASTLYAAMSEEDVAAAVDAALSKEYLDLPQLCSPPQLAAATINQGDVNGVLPFKDNEALITSHLNDNSNRSYSLSAACRAFLTQRRQEVQNVLNFVVDHRNRSVREMRAAADARAAEMERVLSTELRHLQSQITEQQQETLAQGQRHDVAVDATPSLRDVSTTVHDGVAALATNTLSASKKMSSTAEVNAADFVKTSSPTSAADPYTLQAALADAQRALLLEQRHTALLRRDVEDLHHARYTTTALAEVAETLKDVRDSIAQLVRDAVDNMQGVAMRTNDDQWRSREQEPADEKSRWRRLREDETESPRRSAMPTAATVSGSRAQTVHIDGALLLSVRKAVLLAEAQVERVGEEVLGETRRGRFVDALDAAAAAEAPSTNGTPSGLEAGVASSGRGAPTPSAASRSEKQQRIYADLKGLLHRSHVEVSGAAHGETYTAPPPSAFVTRYSPDGSRWVAGIRPPPQRTSSSSVLPVGAVVSPARSPAATSAAVPSPYVRAYVRSLGGAPAAVLSTYTAPTRPHGTTSSSTRSSSTALRLLEGMMTTAQELRNVGNLLEVLRENAATQVELQQASLLRWEERITRVVGEGLDKVTAMLQAMRPPLASLELLQRRGLHDRRGSTALFPTALSGMTAEGAEDSPRHSPQGRLAGVLAGKPMVREAASTGAVCYSYSA